MRKVLLILLMFALVACSAPEDNEPKNPEETMAVGGGAGSYSILLPFTSSPLRQAYAINYRETDLMEMGRGLMEKSKSVFDPKTYAVSEGSLLTPDRYFELLGRESDNNVYGLNKEGSHEPEEGVVLDRPQFVSNLVEMNFHKTNNKDQVDAVSVAMVMKRIQTLDPFVGSTYRLSDEDLYQVGINLGSQLHSYMRSLENMSDVPIFIALYVQESDQDSLPGKYLPGYYIGHALFESARHGEFVRTYESWELLNSETVLKVLPETYSDFAQFKRNLTNFMGDESVGVVGKAFMESSEIKRIQIEINTGAKTYIELYGLAESVRRDIALFEDLGVDISVNIMIFQNTRMIIHKTVGNDAIIIPLN